ALRGLALGSTPRASEAAAIAVEAAELVAASDGRAAAADYLAGGARSILFAGTAQGAGAGARLRPTLGRGSPPRSCSREQPRRRGRPPATVSPSRTVAATGPGRCCADTTSIAWTRKTLRIPAS